MGKGRYDLRYCNILLYQSKLMNGIEFDRLCSSAHKEFQIEAELIKFLVVEELDSSLAVL